MWTNLGHFRQHPLQGAIQRRGCGRVACGERGQVSVSVRMGGGGGQGRGFDTLSRHCLERFESRVARATGNSENTAGPVLLGTWTQNYSTEFSPMKYQVTVTEMVAPDPQRGGEPCAARPWPGRPTCPQVVVPSGMCPSVPWGSHY